MQIGFIGDVHGCAHQCLAAILKLHRTGPLDAIFQVGDLGAWADVNTMYKRDPPAKRFADDNPRTLDWFDLLDPASANADAFGRIRAELGQSVFMIRGNHDDPEWLEAGAVDPFDLFRYVPDGTVMSFDGIRIGFLGGIEIDSEWPVEVLRYSKPHAIDERALEALKVQNLDVLVTHDGPYGVATNWRGEIQGSKLITELVERARPRWHIAGHYHHLIGPQSQGCSQYVGLNCLVHPLQSIWETSPFDPSGCVQATSILVLDTERGLLTFPSSESMRHLDKGWDVSTI